MFRTAESARVFTASLSPTCPLRASGSGMQLARRLSCSGSNHLLSEVSALEADGFFLPSSSLSIRKPPEETHTCFFFFYLQDAHLILQGLQAVKQDCLL